MQESLAQGPAGLYPLRDHCIHAHSWFALERSPWKIGREEAIVPVAILNDISVIECATFVTGPYATALLADLGAQVIKIESAPEGDPYCYFAPDAHFSFDFAHLDRNKESLLLDLKAPEGKSICLELAKKADVFVENFRPGAAVGDLQSRGVTKTLSLYSWFCCR